ETERLEAVTLAMTGTRPNEQLHGLTLLGAQHLHSCGSAFLPMNTCATSLLSRGQARCKEIKHPKRPRPPIFFLTAPVLGGYDQVAHVFILNFGDCRGIRQHCHFL